MKFLVVPKQFVTVFVSRSATLHEIMILSLNKITPYTANAKNTFPIQNKRYRSTAFKLVDTGAETFAPLNILMSTRNMVMSSPIRPGTISGLIKKDAQDTTTNNIDVK